MSGKAAGDLCTVPAFVKVVLLLLSLVLGTGCKPEPVCGDGEREGVEACDGQDLAGATCAAQGFASGTLACREDCTWDRSACVGGCGNGVAEVAEACDDGNDVDLDGCTSCAVTEFVVEVPGVHQMTRALADDGRFVVIWKGETAEARVRGQVFDPTGRPEGPPLDVEVPLPAASAVSVAMAPGGEFVVVSQDTSTAPNQVLGRRFGAGGAARGPWFSVASDTGGRSAWGPQAAINGADELIVVWPGEDHVLARGFDASGSPLGPEFTVSDHLRGEWSPISVAIARGHRAVIAFNTREYDGVGVVAVRCDLGVGPEAPEIFVSEDATGVPLLPQVAMADDGAFVLTWVTTGAPESSAYSSAQPFDADGAPRGPPFLVDAGPSVLFGVGMAADGRVVITYQTFSPPEGLFARLLDAAGAPVSSPIRLPTLAHAVHGIPDSFAISRDGRFAALWKVEDYPIAGEQIVVGQRFDADGSPLGTLPFPGAE